MNPAGRRVYITPAMHTPRTLGLALVAAGLAVVPTLLPAQAGTDAPPAPAVSCATPDTLLVLGNGRVTEATVRSQIGFVAGATLTGADLQRALRALYATGQFQDVRLSCVVRDAGRTALQVALVERPLLGRVTVEGTDIVGERTVRDRISLPEGLPLDPAAVARSAAAIDSLYEARGYYLSQVTVDSAATAGRVDLTFRVEEGGRLAISGIEIVGNTRVSTEDIVAAMQTKPEGFLWFRRGAFDETEFAADVGQRIPALYASRGYIDAGVTQDTVVVDRALGKGLIRLTVSEGPQYRLGAFDVVGNQRFSDEQVRAFYPFTGEGPTLTQRVTDVLRGRDREEGVFDQARWEAATGRLQEAYSNEGYLFARVQPVAERTVGPDSVPVVNLRWDIVEGDPAIINRVEIVGNDYTEEACIRRQLVTVPGDVFNRERLIRSWQSIQNLGFFETPMPSPDIQPANDEGDVDVIFEVKEKRTGNVSFGATMGEGTGIGGFIALDQPNLFGQCKRGSIQWQYGRYVNDANISYTDPAINGSLVSGTVQAYNTRSRYYIGDLGRSIRTGGSLRVGFPFRRSNFTRVFLSYGGESVSFGDEGLLGRVDETTGFEGSSFRSTLGLDLVRDTRIGMPFPVAGTTQNISAQFNGGPLGGNTSFQRYTAELRGYAPIASIGGGRPGSTPMEVVFGLTGRAGTLFGDPKQFFFSQQFALGGVQYGEQLRGYPEFSITPEGFADSTDQSYAQRNSFGSSFFTATAELGLRVSSSLYVNTFLDAGNVWRRPRDFNPTRLFRGAGFGVSTVTPLGPLGLDYAYGFDRTERDPVTGIVRPAPRWQFHFRLGQLF
jgi:outer membrane protein insertion porin family